MRDPSHIGALIKLAGEDRLFFRPTEPTRIRWTPISEEEQELLDRAKAERESDIASDALGRLSSIEKHRQYLSDLRNKRLPNPSPFNYFGYLLDKMCQHNPLYKLTHGKSYQEELDSAYDDAVKDVRKYIRGDIYTPGSTGAKRLEEHSRTV